MLAHRAGSGLAFHRLTSHRSSARTSGGTRLPGDGLSRCACGTRGTWPALRARLLHPGHRLLADRARAGLASHRLPRERCGRGATLGPRSAGRARHGCRTRSTLRTLRTWSTGAPLSAGLLRHPRDSLLSDRTCAGLAFHGLTGQCSRGGIGTASRRTGNTGLRWRALCILPGIIVLIPRRRRRLPLAGRGSLRRAAHTERRGLNLRTAITGSTDGAGLNLGTVIARRAEGARLHLRAIGTGRGLRARAAARGGLFGLGDVFLAHDLGEIELLHLRRLIPGMAATRAFQRAAFLPQKLCRQLKRSCAVRTRYSHLSPYPHDGSFFIVQDTVLMGAKR